MQYEFEVGIHEVEKCFDFAEKLYARRAASLRQFGTEISRVKEDYISDHVRGKVVEYGFKAFLEHHFNISFDVDCNIYDGQLNTDKGNDLAQVYINGMRRSFDFKTDIKGVRARAQWLLIESHKFWAQIYVIGKLTNIPDGEGFEKAPYSFKSSDWIVRIEGYILNKDIYDNNTSLPWFPFYRGDRLFSSRTIKGLQDEKRRLNPIEFKMLLDRRVEEISKLSPNSVYIGGPLDCELNYGYPIKWLRNSQEDWEHFKNILINYSKLEK